MRLADPFYERETQQYDNPLPSREYVLQLLAERGVPMPFSELAAALDIAPHELDFFDRRLRAMERDGQVVRNRRDAYLLPAKADLIKGRVEGHPDGFGFLRRDDGEPDVFLGPKEMREVLHGDRVMVRISGTDRRGRHLVSRRARPLRARAARARTARARAGSQLALDRRSPAGWYGRRFAAR